MVYLAKQLFGKSKKVGRGKGRDLLKKSFTLAYSQNVVLMSKKKGLSCPNWGVGGQNLFFRPSSKNLVWESKY